MNAYVVGTAAAHAPASQGDVDRGAATGGHLGGFVLALTYAWIEHHEPSTASLGAARPPLQKARPFPNAPNCEYLQFDGCGPTVQLASDF